MAGYVKQPRRPAMRAPAPLRTMRSTARPCSTRRIDSAGIDGARVGHQFFRVECEQLGFGAAAGDRSTAQSTRPRRRPPRRAQGRPGPADRSGLGLAPPGHRHRAGDLRLIHLCLWVIRSHVYYSRCQSRIIQPLSWRPVLENAVCVVTAVVALGGNAFTREWQRRHLRRASAVTRCDGAQRQRPARRRVARSRLCTATARRSATSPSSRRRARPSSPPSRCSPSTR